VLQLPDQVDIDTQIVRLQTYRKSLQIYLQQLAVVGTAQAPAHIIHNISECRHNIRRIKSILLNWDVPTDDHPDDEDMSQNQENAALPRQSDKGAISTETNEILDRLNQGTNLPSFGDIFVGKVLDMDEDLVLVEVPGFDPKIVPGVIRTYNLAGNKYRKGGNARCRVTAVKQTKTGKIAIELKPISGRK
jgi:hypothetical protein